MTDEADAKLARLHVNLSLALLGQVTSEELKPLKHYFSPQIGNGEQEHITDFLDLWKILDKKKLIGLCEYSILKDALKEVNLLCHLHLIDTFEKKMGSAKPNDRLRGWIIYNKTVESVEALNKMMEKYKLLFPECHGFELDNAVFSFISNSGGQIQLRDELVTLRVPADALSTDEPQIFWIFRPKAELKDGLELRLATDRDSRSIVKYSLPVRIGPEGVSFKKPVVLTITDFSCPDFTNGSRKPMYMYRKKDGNNSWIELGSCFCDAAKLTASAHLNEFSSYVLGLPATGHTHRLNVHVLVGYKRAEDIDDCALHVYLLLNDHSYVWEFVQEHTLCVIRQACLYLDTQEDLNVCVVSTSEAEYNKKVRKEVLQALAEFPVQIIPGPMVRHCENATLTLLQGADCLLRLPFVTATRKQRAQDTKITATTTVSVVSATDDQCASQAEESTDELEMDCSSKVLIGGRNPGLAATVLNTATMMAPLQSRLSEQTSECEKMEVEMWKGSAEEDIPVAGCAKTNRSVDKASTSDNIRSLHNRLGLALEKQLVSDDLMRLKHYFHGCGLGSRELDSLTNFLELWRKLEVNKIIEPYKYSKLVDALKAIDALAQIRVIQQFEEVMTSKAMYMPPNKKLASSLEMHLSLEDTTPSHKKLILALEVQLTSVEIRRLKRYFIDGRIVSRGDLESVPDDILELFPLLERKKIIELGKYSNMKDALKAIGETESIRVIEEFETKIEQEAILRLRKLASALERHLTPQDVKRLKCFFKDHIAPRGDLDSVPDDILELLSLLEQKKIIEPGKYYKLKDALKTIGKMDCSRIIDDFEKGIKEVAAGGVDVPTTAKYMKGSDSSGSASSAYSKC